MSLEDVIAIAAEIALAPGEEPVAVAKPLSGEQFDLAALVQRAEEFSKRWVIEVPQLGEVLEQLAKNETYSFFMVPEIAGHTFVTNAPLLPGASVVIIDGGQIGARAVEKAPAKSVEDDSDRVVSKVFKTEEERYVLGVVLAPETTDSQGDIYSHEEVRKAAHAYMEHEGALGKQHREIVTGKLKILESYVAPVDFQIEEEQVAKGTWLMGIRVVDDDLWTGIKEGSFTGFSIGGAAFRRPEVT